MLIHLPHARGLGFTPRIHSACYALMQEQCGWHLGDTGSLCAVAWLTSGDIFNQDHVRCICSSLCII